MTAPQTAPVKQPVLQNVIETTEAKTENSEEITQELSAKEQEMLDYFKSWPESEQRRFAAFASWMKSAGKI